LAPAQRALFKRLQDFFPDRISRSGRFPGSLAAAKFALEDLSIGVGEDAEILLSVAEDILMRRSLPWSEAAFSPFPTVRHLEKATLGRWRQKRLLRFPQIHRAHHNNKLYSGRKSVLLLWC
jgi:hypothetical protein